MNTAEKRPWGYYTVIDKGDGYLVKIIVVEPKQKLSVQSHNHRSEHWIVLTGRASVLLDDKEFLMEQGQSLDININQIHSLQNPFSETLKILEVQRGDILSEEDIIRYKDIYGRV